MVWKKMLEPSRIYPVVLVILMYGWYKWQYEVEEPDVSGYMTLKGETMGTTFKITYYDSTETDYSKEVLARLKEFNMVFSTYEEESQLSILNSSDTLINPHPWLINILEASDSVYRITNGAFNPTVKPLVNLWGFGHKANDTEPTQNEIDSLLLLCRFENVTWSDSLVVLSNGTSLDFNAIAKGYGVDLVAELLEEKGLERVFVEIGGEIRVLGRHSEERPWRTAIETPTYDKSQREGYGAVELESTAMATSGDYRNYRKTNESKVSHTIDPSTGRSVDHDLHSVTIVHDKCLIADALATAINVLGPDKGEVLAKELNVKYYMLYGDITAPKEKGDMSIKKFSE